MKQAHLSPNFWISSLRVKQVYHFSLQRLMFSMYLSFVKRFDVLMNVFVIALCHMFAGRRLIFFSFSIECASYSTMLPLLTVHHISRAFLLLSLGDSSEQENLKLLRILFVNC